MHTLAMIAAFVMMGLTVHLAWAEEPQSETKYLLQQERILDAKREPRPERKITCELDDLGGADCSVKNPQKYSLKAE